MTENMLRSKLKEIYSDEKDIDVAIFKISLFKPELIKAFVHYVESGEILEISVYGNTIRSISKKTNLSNIEAFFIMDKLMKDEDYRKLFPSMSFGEK